jgi:hypothetical protein
MSFEIRNPWGEVIQRSKNLRGIRRKVGRDEVRHIGVRQCEDNSGVLYILFQNGDNFSTHFASFEVLKTSLRNWRNLHGCLIFINGSWARVDKKLCV